MKRFRTYDGFFKLIALVPVFGLISCLSSNSNVKKSKQEYSTYSSFTELVNSTDAKYPQAVRITDGGTEKNPAYHGFFFYNCAPADLLQFDPTGRYMLGMSVSIEGREVTATDKGEIGIIDLKNNNKWTYRKNCIRTSNGQTHLS